MTEQEKEGWTGIERFKCGCVLYLRDNGVDEVIVKVKTCELHKDRDGGENEQANSDR